jgi:hypothetical protein
LSTRLAKEMSPPAPTRLPEKGEHPPHREEPESRGFRKGLDQMSVEPAIVDGIDDHVDKAIRYHPLPREQQVYDEINKAVDEVWVNLYRDVEEALERFYLSVRVPTWKVVEGKRVAARDEDTGEVIWQTDDLGNPIEDWTRLEGTILEEMIQVLGRAILNASKEVSRLYTEMFTADRERSGDYWDGYGSVISGTIEDKTAAAMRNSRGTRFYFVYKYTVWKRLSDRLDDLREAKRSLEFFRGRQQRSEGR